MKRANRRCTRQGAPPELIRWRLCGRSKTCAAVRAIEQSRDGYGAVGRFFTTPSATVAARIRCRPIREGPHPLTAAPLSPTSVSRCWCRTLPTTTSSERTNSPLFVCPEELRGVHARSSNVFGALRVRFLEFDSRRAYACFAYCVDGNSIAGSDTRPV